MRTYASSRVKRKSFYRKNELQMFLLISGGHIGGQFLSTNMGHKDLRFGQIVYVLVFWLLPLDGFKCIFLCRVYCVTVKAKNTGSWSPVSQSEVRASNPV